MSFTNISLALACALLLGLFSRGRGRVYALMIVSVVWLYWLQPSLRIDGYEFWLSTTLLGMIVLSWGFVSGPDQARGRESLLTALGLIGLVAVIEAASRLNPFHQIERLARFGAAGWPWFSFSPLAGYATLALVLFLAAALGLSRLPGKKAIGLGIMMAVLLGVFVCIKWAGFPAHFQEWVISISKALTGHTIPRRAAFDLRWFGFSYIAFRLIHTLRDRQMGRLPPVSLAEYIVYVTFFPALAAGPIDRIERFIKDLRQPIPLDPAGWLEAGQRLFVGLFKKFVLAALLGFIALSPANLPFVTSTAWLWLMLYGYSLQVYLDFSGYTDIAIGLGRLMGVKLPENFNNPYLKPNLTQFWNNWHMTLTQWFRAYCFNPLTRWLRGGLKLPAWGIIFITQVATMTLIGLWHGITWNFVAWGLWHGLGLFLQNRWSESIRPRAAEWLTTPARQRLAEGLGILVTFNFISLGWVFFGMTNLQDSFAVFQKLFGI